MVGEGKHSLGAVEVRGLGLEQTTHEGVKEGHVQQPHNGKAHTGDQREVVHTLFLLLGSLLAAVGVAVRVVVAVLVLAVI